MYGMDLSIAGPEAGKHHKQNFGNLSYPHETMMSAREYIDRDILRMQKQIHCPSQVFLRRREDSARIQAGNIS
jgi:hypothetical protein